jgi:hypothetical protein
MVQFIVVQNISIKCLWFIFLKMDIMFYYPISYCQTKAQLHTLPHLDILLKHAQLIIYNSIRGIYKGGCGGQIPHRIFLKLYEIVFLM